MLGDCPKDKLKFCYEGNGKERYRNLQSDYCFLPFSFSLTSWILKLPNIDIATITFQHQRRRLQQERYENNASPCYTQTAFFIGRCFLCRPLEALCEKHSHVMIFLVHSLQLLGLFVQVS